MGRHETSSNSLASTRRPQFSDYKLVFLCPMPVEQEALLQVFDEIHENEPLRNANQRISYCFGKIASYNAAIAFYPGGEVGIGVSGRMVSEVLRDFGKGILGMLVGISAGIPSPTRDIRLGDVAVAHPNRACPGTAGYDMVKIEEDGTVAKQWQNSTDSSLRSAMSKLQVLGNIPGHNFRRHLETASQRDPRYLRPPTQARSPEFSDSPTQRKLDDNSPEVHYGTILSGNGVIKWNERRDEIGNKWDGIAIEMEAAGIMNELGVAVIRGITDFADERKNDEWHQYAALAAAAYAKELVIKLGACEAAQQDIGPESAISIDLDGCLGRRLPLGLPHFVGRRVELETLREFFSSQPQRGRAKTMAVYGLSGVGKSQLVAEFVHDLMKDKGMPCDIVWINGETKEAFDESMADYLKRSPGSENGAPQENYEEQRTIQIKSFFDELKGNRLRKWLLVVDGISSDEETQDYIFGLIQGAMNGSVIFTTQNNSLAMRTTDRFEIRGLAEDDAVKFMQKATAETILGNEKELAEVVRAFNCHPLSLSVAAAALAKGFQPAVDYIDKWKRHQFEHAPRVEKQKLILCFEASFAELESASPSAAYLLMLFSYLDHKDLWIDLCKVVIKDRSWPLWLREIATLPNPKQLCFQLRDLSFVEQKKQVQAEDFIWEVHPVIHEIARQRAQNMNMEWHFIENAVSLVAANVPRSEDYDFLATARRLAPHAEQCKIYLKQNRSRSAPSPADTKGFGDLHRHLGRFEEARQFYEQSLMGLSDQPGLDQTSLELKADVLNGLGLVYHHRKQYDAAVTTLEASSAVYRQLGQENSVVAITLLHSIGQSLLMQNKLDLALEKFETAVAILKPSEFPEGSSQDGTAKSSAAHLYYRVLNDAGEIHFRKEDLVRAEQSFGLTLDGLSGLFNENHPSTFTVRLNIGRVEALKQAYDEAKKTIQLVIETYMSWWGRRHAETMRAVEEMAVTEARHGLRKREMAENGDEELGRAVALMEEVSKFHTEVYGVNSTSAQMAGKKLQLVVGLEGNQKCEDFYLMNRNSADVRDAVS